jgi:hypothetical protein
MPEIIIVVIQIVMRIVPSMHKVNYTSCTIDNYHQNLDSYNCWLWQGDNRIDMVGEQVCIYR